MDLKKVKELIDIMKENELVELEVVDGDSKIHLKGPHAAIPVVASVPSPAAVAATPSAAPVEAVDDGLIGIESPIVGTFYQAASPDSDPYANVGDQVSADTVVCIIEAMKVMNEIKAETGGVIAEVCCKDGEAIEFGQVLFKVRP
ncbi:MAG: acetyl-CoA carboxylase, biotin carboxyl carrier protein [Planctomycetales bacterium 4572_13]|nr:MAG: acetyl-CoA carboxylase, biotin carboxyl carrier protein [Planctomycetales bacterium 4572_13]